CLPGRSRSGIDAAHRPGAQGPARLARSAPRGLRDPHHRARRLGKEIVDQARRGQGYRREKAPAPGPTAPRPAPARKRDRESVGSDAVILTSLNFPGGQRISITVAIAPGGKLTFKPSPIAT